MSAPADPWLTVADIKARFRLRSDTSVWNWVAAKLLPPPHHLRQRAVWRSSEIDAAEARLITPPPKAA